MAEDLPKVGSRETQLAGQSENGKKAAERKLVRNHKATF